MLKYIRFTAIQSDLNRHKKWAKNKAEEKEMHLGRSNSMYW